MVCNGTESLEAAIQSKQSEELSVTFEQTVQEDQSLPSEVDLLFSLKRSAKQRILIKLECLGFLIHGLL